MHDLLTVGLPLLAILAGILFSRSDVKDLRADVNSRLSRIEDQLVRLNADTNARFNKVEDQMKRTDADLRSEMGSRFNKVEDHLGRIDADLRQFYHLTGKLEARVDAIDKQN